MSLLVGYDGFDYAAGTLSSPWTIKTGDVFGTDGNRTWAYDTVNPVGVLGGTARLAILGDFYSLISTVAGAKLMRVQCSMLMPSAFASFTMQAGIVGFSAGANSTPHFECVWQRTGGGTNTLVVFLRTSGGQTQLASASITAVAASESHELRVQFYMTTVGLQIAVYWDSVLTVTAGVPNSTLALYGFTGTAQTNPHYVGLFGTSSGVSNTGSFGTPVYVGTTPVLIDDFKVFDEAYTDTATPIYAAPTLTADPTLATIAVQAENDSTGDTFTLKPSFAIKVVNQYETREHPFDGGHVQTVARAAGRRRRWSLKWDALSSAQRSTFVTHIATVSGKKKAFAWQDPDTGIAVVVRFVEDPVISQVGPSVWSAAAVAEEIGG